MLYNLNEFFLHDVGRGTRIFGYPNVDVALALKTSYMGKGAQILHLSELFDDELRILPTPAQLLRLLDEKVDEVRGKTFFVVGVDAYLSLLIDSGKTAFLTELQKRLDLLNQPNLIIPIFLETLENSPLTNHPKYQEAKSVVLFEGVAEVQRTTTITVVPEAWLPKDAAKVAASYKGLLQKLGEFQSQGAYYLKVIDAKKYSGTPFEYLLDPYEFAKQKFNFDASLDARTLEILLQQGAVLGTTPENTLKKLFEIEDFSDKALVLKRLLELAGSPLWQGFLWLSRQKAPDDSYLSLVLSQDITATNLLRRYVVEGVVQALKTLNDVDLTHFAEERKSTLHLLEDSYPAIKTFIKELIGYVRDVKKAVLFLNCKTDWEKIEIVRRVARLDYSDDLSEVYYERFALLGDYLTPGDCYYNPILKEYFDEYRRLKLRDEVTPEFVQRAASACSEVNIENLCARDKVLNTNFSDVQTGVLVVDGMGAEYMPALIAAADRYGLKVDFAEVVTARRPTATKFNTVTCDINCKIDEIKGIDVVAHNGANLHEGCTREENIYASLREFERVFQRVRENLNKFQRVVVTSDHGTSRLAVVAHNHGLSKTIKLDKQIQPKDWRYTKATPDKEPPEGMKQEYVPKENENYWVVVGYDRLSVSGGKLNELHGGETLEEVCVPLVVYSLKSGIDVYETSSQTMALEEDKVLSKPTVTNESTLDQIEEDDAFADL